MSFQGRTLLIISVTFTSGGLGFFGSAEEPRRFSDPQDRRNGESAA